MVICLNQMVGDAGIGKTTLCISISEDWANDKLFCEFNLLLLLPLREKEVASAGSLSELLALLHFSPSLRSSVSNIIEEEEGEIVADGCSVKLNVMINHFCTNYFSVNFLLLHLSC